MFLFFSFVRFMENPFSGGVKVFPAFSRWNLFVIFFPLFPDVALCLSFFYSLSGLFFSLPSACLFTSPGTGEGNHFSPTI